VDGNRASLEELARRNVTVTTLDAEQKAAFARVTRPVYDKWAQTVGADLVRRAEAAVRGARA
jgi:TRAP-type C4-dicarboxylate transport system substrate-binding protein